MSFLGSSCWSRSTSYYSQSGPTRAASRITCSSCKPNFGFWSGSCCRHARYISCLVYNCSLGRLFFAWLGGWRWQAECKRFKMLNEEWVTQTLWSFAYLVIHYLQPRSRYFEIKCFCFVKPNCGNDKNISEFSTQLSSLFVVSDVNYIDFSLELIYTKITSHSKSLLPANSRLSSWHLKLTVSRLIMQYQGNFTYHKEPEIGAGKMA